MKNKNKENEFILAKNIIRLCEDYFGFPLEGNERVSRDVSERKMLSRYFVNKYCARLGWTDIGRIFGVGHDTVIYSCDRVSTLLDLGGSFTEDYQNLKGLIESSDGVREMIKLRTSSRRKFILNEEINSLDDEDLNDVIELIRNFKKAKEEFRNTLDNIIQINND